jgi:hypothetical protein
MNRPTTKLLTFQATFARLAPPHGHLFEQVYIRPCFHSCIWENCVKLHRTKLHCDLHSMIEVVHQRLWKMVGGLEWPHPESYNLLPDICHIIDNQQWSCCWHLCPSMNHRDGWWKTMIGSTKALVLVFSLIAHLSEQHVFGASQTHIGVLLYTSPIASPKTCITGLKSVAQVQTQNMHDRTQKCGPGTSPKHA